MHATDIVAYTFQADTYCPDCILAAVKAAHPLDFPLASTILADDTTEDILRTVAKSLHIAATDERSFDSDEFPKVVFASDAWNNDDYCGKCHRPIIED